VNLVGFIVRKGTQASRFSWREDGGGGSPTLLISADIYRQNSEFIKLTSVTTGYSVQIAMLSCV